MKEVIEAMKIVKKKCDEQKTCGKCPINTICCGEDPAHWNKKELATNYIKDQKHEVQ